MTTRSYCLSLISQVSLEGLVQEIAAPCRRMAGRTRSLAAAQACLGWAFLGNLYSAWIEGRCRRLRGVREALCCCGERRTAGFRQKRSLELAARFPAAEPTVVPDAGTLIQK